MKPSELLKQAAALYEQKSEEYGDNYLRIGEILDRLFPKGVAIVGVEDFNRFHLLLLMFVKLTRYTENWDKGGHTDSLKDLQVYAAMLEAYDGEK